MAEEAKHSQLTPAQIAAVTAAVPLVYSAQKKLIFKKNPNPFVLALTAGAGYGLARGYNDIVKEHKGDAAKINKAVPGLTHGIIQKHVLGQHEIEKKAGALSSIGGVMAKGIKAGVGGVVDVAKAVVAKPAPNAGIGRKLLRPLALTGAAYGAYRVGKYTVNSAKPLNYGDYEKNLVNYGHITPDQMSRSGFNAMVKEGVLNVAMNGLMGYFALESGKEAMKKAKTPVMGEGAEASKIYDAGSRPPLNNFR